MGDSRLTDEMIEAAAKALRPWIWIERTGGAVPEIEQARSQSLADASDALTAALALLPDEAAIRADERAKCIAEIKARARKYPEQISEGREGWTLFNRQCGVEEAADVLAARGSAAATEDSE